jgi:hypothetical protein
MLRYNADTIQLLFWQDKLKEFETTRAPLKQELLNLLFSAESPEKRNEAFAARRSQLLSDNHHQGFTWSPHFTWLWNFLAFLGIKINLMPGSKLRSTLMEETPPIKIEKISIREYSREMSYTPLNNQEFTTALFKSPEEAWMDVDTQIAQLGASSEKNSKKITSIIERLEALKYRLEPQIYRQYLEQLSKYAPQEYLLFYANLYETEGVDCPNPHEYLEIYYLARALQQEFISKYEEGITPIQQPIYDYLDMAIVLGSKSNEKILSTFLSNAYSSDKKDGKDIYLTKLKNDYKRKLTLGWNEQRVTLCTTIITNLHEPPLLIQFIRVAVEELLFNHRKISLLGDMVDQSTLTLSTLNLFKGILSSNANLRKEEGMLQLLNPFNQGAVIPAEYQAAEHFCAEILIAATPALERGLEKAKDSCKEYFSHPNALERDWVLSRVKAAIPTLCSQLTSLFDQSLKKESSPDSSVLSSPQTTKKGTISYPHTEGFEFFTPSKNKDDECSASLRKASESDLEICSSLPK